MKKYKVKIAWQSGNFTFQGVDLLDIKKATDGDITWEYLQRTFYDSQAIKKEIVLIMCIVGSWKEPTHSITIF